MSASKSDKIGEMLNLRKKGEDESRSDRIGKTLGLIPEDAEEGGASPVKVLVLGVTVLSALAAIWFLYSENTNSTMGGIPDLYVAGLISITGALLLMFLGRNE